MTGVVLLDQQESPVPRDIGIGAGVPGDEPCAAIDKTLDVLRQQMPKIAEAKLPTWMVRAARRCCQSQRLGIAVGSWPEILV